MNKVDYNLMAQWVKLINNPGNYSKEHVKAGIREMFADPDYFPLFCQLVLDKHFTRSFKDIHYEMMDILDVGRNARNSMLMASRGLGKSTLGVLAQAVYCATIGKNKYILINSYDQKKSIQKVEEIKQEFESNELLRYLYGDPIQDASNWNKSKIRVFNNCVIEAISTGQDPRGLKEQGSRPDLIISDDIINSVDVRSKEMRDNALDWYKKDLLPAMAKKGKSVLIGTPMHPEDLVMSAYDKIAPFTNWQVGKFPAIINGQSVDEEWKSTDELNELSKDEYTFSQEYMCEPMLITSGMIDYDNLKFWNEGELPHKFKKVVIHIDTTHTGKTTSDFCCIMMMGKSESNKFYVIDYVLEKMEVDKQARALINMYKKAKDFDIRVDTVTYDEKSNQGFGHWARELSAKEYDISLPLQPLKYNQDKISHLSEYIPHFRAMNVYLPKQHPSNRQAVDQLTAFPQKGVHDDFVDGISGAMDNLKSEIISEDFSYFY